MTLSERLHKIFYRFPESFPLPFVLDGATGTALMKLGMPSGSCTEIYITENPDKINKIQSAYGKSGSDAVLAPTFGANRSVLKRHYIDETRVDELNKTLVAISKKSRCSCLSCNNASSGSTDLKNLKNSELLIGADISPTGCFIEPYGETPFETVVDIYREQVKSLLEAGVDFFMTETNISLSEARAAVIAIRELDEDIPVFVTMTVDENGRTMSGDSLECALLTLGELGINAFGTNCSTGPEEMIKSLLKAVPYAVSMGIPLIAKPNSGIPHENEDGTQTFSLTADDMEKYIPQFFEAGIFVLGGCCGTDEKYISLLRKYSDSLNPSNNLIKNIKKLKNDIPDIKNLAASNRAVIDISEIDIKNVEFIPADDEFCDNLSECEDDFICVDLESDGADIFLENIAYINTPVIIRGEKSQIETVRRVYNGKLGVIAYF